MILGRVILAPPERTELKRRARSRSLAVEAVRRAKVILMLAGGGSYSEIGERLRCTDRYINLWKERFQPRAIERLGFALPWSRVPPSDCANRGSHFGVDPERTD
jgi:hypothetical protein